jgi:hypothetical protein
MTTVRYSTSCFKWLIEAAGTALPAFVYSILVQALHCLGWIFRLGFSDNIKGVTINMALQSSARTELDGERLSKK